MEDSVEKLPVEIAQTHGERDPFAEFPLWSLWLSTVTLSLAFIIGLPLNGATVLIFWRRKKLRHLVNFVLLLDCLSHIVLCLVCIPIHLVSVWSSASLAAAGLSGLSALQQVVGNFSNVYSTFLTVSIAILRYRRLCWKKKDKFSTSNAIKWSVLSGGVAIALTIAQSYSSFLSNDEKTTLTFYMIKISLILLSMAIVFFCYIRVSQRVWVNAASQEKVMDPMKLKKSRSVHLRATIHSCVQIILVIATLSPHLYEQTLEALSTRRILLQYPEPAKLSDAWSPSDGESPSPSSVGVHKEFISMGDSQHNAAEAIVLVEDDSSSTMSSSSSDNHLAWLIGITINYALLILGTPMAYIASCHRFREQFTSILFSHIINNSPQNSGCNNANSPRHNHHQPRNQISSCSGFRGCRSHSHGHHGHCGSQTPSPGRIYSNTRDRLYSSSTTTTTTSKTAGINMAARNSISTNNTSSNTVTTSRSHSIKSRSSMKRERGASCRRKGSRGLLGTDFIIVDSESTAMLQDQDLSNSTNPKETPTPSPTMTNEGTANGSGGSCCDDKKHSCTSITLRTFVSGNIESMGRKSSLHTILQNYGYDFTDLGELV